MSDAKASLATSSRCEERSRTIPDDIDLDEDSIFPPPPTLTAEEESKLWSKVDWRLMPVLWLNYLFLFMNRDDMEPEQNHPKLFHFRMWLGIAEAILFPVVVRHIALWYPRHKLQLRIGFLCGAASLGGAFSGLLAYTTRFMSSTQKSFIFKLEGAASMIVGVLSLFVLFQEFPSTAKFLTLEERAWVARRMNYDNSSAGEEEHIQPQFVRVVVTAVLTDWQVWFHILAYISVIGPLGGITLFLPMLIESFGYPPVIGQLLIVPPYVLATILVLVFAHYSDKMKMRSPFIMLGLAFCLIGLIINLSGAPNGVKYFGTFFVVSGSYAAFPAIIAWLGNNVAGQYKRGYEMELHIIFGNFGAVLASGVYRSQDSPRFFIGHGCLLLFVVAGFVIVQTIVRSYVRINNKRDEDAKVALESGEKNQYTDQQLREMGDRAPDFRYTL